MKKYNEGSGHLVLRLYVAGLSSKCLIALQNLKNICENEVEGSYEIEVVDLLENPQLGQEDQILAVPTVVRKAPKPALRVTGDLSNKERVMMGLNLIPRFDSL